MARSPVLAERKETIMEHLELMAGNREENPGLQELWIVRLQLEAQTQAEAQAHRAQEEQAWVQLKEQEVLKTAGGKKNFTTRENLEAQIEESR